MTKQECATVCPTFERAILIRAAVVLKASPYAQGWLKGPVSSETPGPRLVPRADLGRLPAPLSR